jgi:hypothetical protein
LTLRLSAIAFGLGSLLAGASLAACTVEPASDDGGGGTGAGDGSGAGGTATCSDPPNDAKVCALLPEDVVSGLAAPLGHGALTGKGVDYAPYCQYSSGEHVPEVQILVDPTWFCDETDAHEAYANAKSMQKSAEDLTGYGDEAYLSTEDVSSSVKVRRGRMLMQVNVGLDKQPCDTCSAVAKQIVTEALNRLPE